MADDSELDYIRTFLGKVHTTATVKHWDEARQLSQINDTSKILVKMGTIMHSTQYVTVKRFKLLLSETTEAALSTAHNNIAIGCDKLNRRIAITEYTRPTSFLHAEIATSNLARIKGNAKNWILEIDLDCKFMTS